MTPRHEHDRPLVFISYSRQDERFVRELQNALGQSCRPWIDWRDIPATAEWSAEILRAIERCHAFLFVLSPNSVSSTMCLGELRQAVSLGKRLLPLRLAAMNDTSVPTEVAAIQHIVHESSSGVRDTADQVLRALETDLEWLRFHTELLNRALDWTRHDREHSRLLRASSLRQAETRLASQTRPPSAAIVDIQSAYVVASRRAARRRGALATALLGLVALALTGLLINAVRTERESRHRLAANLAQQGWSRVDLGDSFGALLQMVEALELEPQSPAHRMRVNSVLALSPRVIRARAFDPPGASHTLGQLWPIATAGYFGREDDAYVVTRNGGLCAWRRMPNDSVQPDWGVIEIGSASDWVCRDGHLVALVGGRTQTWSLETGRSTLGPELEPPALDEHVFETKLAPDGARVLRRVGRAYKRYARVYDSSTGRLVGEPLRLSTDVELVEFSANGAACVVSDKRGRARAWSALDAKPLGPEIDLGKSVRVTSSHDGHLLATYGAPDNLVEIWRSSTGASVGAPIAAPQSLCCSFSPDGSLLVVGCHSGTAILHDLRAPATNETLVRALPVWSATFDPHSRWIALQCGDEQRRELVVWIRSGQRVIALPELRLAGVSEDGARVLTSDAYGTLSDWDLSLPRQVPAPERVLQSEHHRFLLSADGARVVAACDGPTVVSWRADDSSIAGPGVELSPREGLHAIDGTGRFALLTPTMDGPGVRGRTRVVDLDDGAPLVDLPSTSGVISGSLSPGGKFLAIVEARECVARVWDTASGAELIAVRYSAEAPWVAGLSSGAGVAFDDRGEHVAVFTPPSTLRFFELPSARRVLASTRATFAPEGIVLVSPRGEWVAANATAGHVERWDVPSGATLPSTVSLPSTLTCLAFSPDDSLVAAGCVGSLARAWNCATGVATTRHLEHAGAVTSLAFDPTSRFLATASADRTVRMWDIDGGDAVTPPLPHSEAVTAIVFADGGERLVALDANGTVTHWQLGARGASLSDARRLASALARRRADEAGGLAPISFMEAQSLLLRGPAND